MYKVGIKFKIIMANHFRSDMKLWLKLEARHLKAKVKKSNVLWFSVPKVFLIDLSSLVFPIFCILPWG